MKKIILLVIVLLTFVVTAVFSQVNIPITVSDSLNLKVSGAMVTSGLLNSNPDIDPFLLGQRSIINFMISKGISSAVLEFGSVQDVNMKTRIAELSFKSEKYQFVIGQGYIDGMKRFVGQIVDENLVMDYSSRAGAFYMGRKLRATMRILGTNIVFITLMEVIKPTVDFHGTPRIIIGSNIKFDKLSITPVVGWGHYWNSNNNYDAVVTGILFEHPSLLGIKSTLQVWGGINPGDFGLTALPSGIAQDSKSKSGGGLIEFSKSNITLGSGLSKVYSSEKELGTVFLQYNFVVLKYIQMTSEIGLFYGNQLKRNTGYIGLRPMFKF